MRQVLFALIAVLFCASGCIDIEPYQEITGYDLFYDRLDAKVPVSFYVAEFKDLTGTGGRMQIRHADGHISKVPEARWTLHPGILIPRALNEILPQAANSAGAQRINGTLLRFEANLGSRTFVLSGSWVKAGSGRTVPFNISVPLTGTTPQAITAAASNAVAELAENIAAGQ